MGCKRLNKEFLPYYLRDVGQKWDVARNNRVNYDNNGNMISDANKEITSILYNLLNLPIKVVFSNSQPDVEWTYDAAGMKVKKVSGGSTGSPTEIKWYLPAGQAGIAGVEYSGSLTEQSRSAPAEIKWYGI